MTDTQAMPVAAPASASETGIIDNDHPPAWTLETPSYVEPPDDPSDDVAGLDLKAMSTALLHTVGSVAVMPQSDRERLVMGVLDEMASRVIVERIVDNE